MNNLTGRSRHSPRHCLVSTEAIASQLVRNGKYEAVDRKSSRLVFQEVSDLWRAATPDTVNISNTFSQREFTAALQHLKPGKAPGPDSICSELILNAGAALKSWLRDFLSSCLRRLKIPKIWRRALVVAMPKPGKPVGDPKSYRSISLLCVPTLERLIYTRVEPLIDPLLPKEQWIDSSRLLPFCPTPTYLGVKLDRSLTFSHHLVALRKKLSSRVTLLRRLVGSR